MVDHFLAASLRDFVSGAYTEVIKQIAPKVKGIAPGRVALEGPEGPRELQAATICWTAGVRASRLGALLAERTSCPVDRGGRLLVEPDFSVPGHPEIHAIGDLCAYHHTADGRPLPGMAGPAVQMGAWVAAAILARSGASTAASGSGSLAPFRFTDLGSMALIGPF